MGVEGIPHSSLLYLGRRDRAEARCPSAHALKRPLPKDKQKPKARNIVRPVPPGLCQGLSSSVDSGAKRSDGRLVSVTQLRSPQTSSQRPCACRAGATCPVTTGGKRFSGGHPRKVSLPVYKMWSPFIVQCETQTRHSHRSHQGTGGVAESRSVCWDSERTRNHRDSVKPMTFRLRCSEEPPGRSSQARRNLVPHRGEGILGEVKGTDLFPK